MTMLNGQEYLAKEVFKIFRLHLIFLEVRQHRAFAYLHDIEGKVLSNEGFMKQHDVLVI